MPFTIAWDASAAAKRERTGVARAAIALIDAILALDRDDEFVLGVRLSRLRRGRFAHRPAASNARVRWFTDALLPLLGSIDLFHGLDARVPRRGTFKKIVTLHDLGPVEDAEIAAPGFREKKRRAYAEIAECADRVICVSSATRDRFRALHPLPEDRYAVIHHGVDAHFTPCLTSDIDAARARFALGPRYLLFVGLVSARKNVVTLVRAFDRLADTEPDLVLALAGGDAHGSEEVDATIAAARHRDRVRRLGFVADDDLPALYSGAAAFVSPGLVEGFGMPLLEAMACGAPVVAADLPVTREVAGDAALAVDCREPEPLTAALDRLLNDRPFTAKLIDRGAAHARKFSWEAAARATLDVYREALEPARPGRESSR